MRFKRQEPEEIFLEDIKKLITNLLITNVNYKNSYYKSNDAYRVIEDTQERANYILERISQIEHLVLPFDEKEDE